MPWADVESVELTYGQVVTDQDIAIAQDIVEVFAGTTELASDNELISTRNLRLLEKAVAYQAIFVRDHPDILSVMDTTGVSQDGLSATYQHDNAALLAPMAKRCIDRLSWKLRPLRARKSGRIDESGNRDSAIADDQYVWTPL